MLGDAPTPRRCADTTREVETLVGAEVNLVKHNVNRHVIALEVPINIERVGGLQEIREADGGYSRSTSSLVMMPA